MGEIYQSLLVVVGIPAIIAIVLGAKLSIRWLSAITLLVAVAWYLDSYLWSIGVIPDGPKLAGIWGGLTSSFHTLFLEAMAPVFLMALWGSCICAAMVRRVVRRRIDTE